MNLVKRFEQRKNHQRGKQNEIRETIHNLGKFPVEVYSYFPLWQVSERLYHICTTKQFLF